MQFSDTTFEVLSLFLHGAWAILLFTSDGFYASLAIKLRGKGKFVDFSPEVLRTSFSSETSMSFAFVAAKAYAELRLQQDALGKKRALKSLNFNSKMEFLRIFPERFRSTPVFWSIKPPRRSQWWRVGGGYSPALQLYPLSLLPT